MKMERLICKVVYPNSMDGVYYLSKFTPTGDFELVSDRRFAMNLNIGLPLKSSIQRKINYVKEYYRGCADVSLIVDNVCIKVGEMYVCDYVLDGTECICVRLTEDKSNALLFDSDDDTIRLINKKVKGRIVEP